MEHEIVSRQAWIEARTALLAREKEFTRRRDELNAERRALPWVKVDKAYVFDGPNGKVTLSDLFAGRRQLFIKHFMLGPGQVGQCVGCSFEVDHLSGIRVHLENHGLTYAVVARAPLAEIEAVRKRMGWDFTRVSSFGSDFNYDFGVSFRPEDMAAGRAFYNYRRTNPGLEDLSGDSVFYKNDAGEVFHTYSTFARGADQLGSTYSLLDLTPKGRNEPPGGNLTDWVRRHDKYDEEKSGKSCCHG